MNPKPTHLDAGTVKDAAVGAGACRAWLGGPVDTCVCAGGLRGYCRQEIVGDFYVLIFVFW